MSFLFNFKTTRITLKGDSCEKMLKCKTKPAKYKKPYDKCFIRLSDYFILQM